MTLMNTILDANNRGIPVYEPDLKLKEPAIDIKTAPNAETTDKVIGRPMYVMTRGSDGVSFEPVPLVVNGERVRGFLEKDILVVETGEGKKMYYRETHAKIMANMMERQIEENRMGMADDTKPIILDQIDVLDVDKMVKNFGYSLIAGVENLPQVSPGGIEAEGGGGEEDDPGDVRSRLLSTDPELLAVVTEVVRQEIEPIFIEREKKEAERLKKERAIFGKALALRKRPRNPRGNRDSV
jgi:hypothetical protein